MKANTAITVDDLKNELREDDFIHDPWGTSINMAFNICNELTIREREVPGELGYSCSILGPEDRESYSHSLICEAPNDVLGTMAMLLNRHMGLCRYYGKDY